MAAALDYAASAALDAAIDPRLGDAFVDFDFVSTRLFMPSRGRKVGITREGLAKLIARDHAARVANPFPKPIDVSASGKRASLRWRISDLRKYLELAVRKGARS